MTETRGQSREEAGRKGGEAAMAAETGSAASITHVLSGIKFPCKKEDIINHAKKQEGDDAIMTKLQNLPKMDFNTMADVMKGIGEESEHRSGKGERSEGKSAGRGESKDKGGEHHRSSNY